MKRKTIGLWLFLAILTVTCSSCGDNSATIYDNRAIRSADPCCIWKLDGWQYGDESVRTPELRDGKASHLRPSEIIYFSVIENSDDPKSPDAKYFVNTVLMLAYLENQSLLSKDKGFGDFESRLFKAYNFGGNAYPGFYPQTVAVTFQWRAYQKKGLSFEEAQAKFPFTGTEDFKQTYAKYARLMNFIAGTSYVENPDSKGYYQDFRHDVIDAEKIQKFLEAIASPLGGDIFKQHPIANSAIDYDKFLSMYGQ